METKDIESMRNDYSDNGIDPSTVSSDPIEQFAEWFQQARDSGMAEPNGMVIATADPLFGTSQRTVLMKSYDQHGFIFYTNYLSRKAGQIEKLPQISCLFPWLALHRQVAIQGQVQRASAEQSKRYFHSRPRESQIGAWASAQSQVMADRSELERKYQQIVERFDGIDVPLPDFWGGFVVRPLRFEFWQGRHSRLHDRLVYTRTNDDPIQWQLQRLYP